MFYHLQFTTQMLYAKNTSTKFTATDLKVEVGIQDSLCEASISQTFIHQEGAPAEMYYNFPKDDQKHLVFEMHFKIDDKTIRSKIMPKEEAKEVYDDGVAAGKAAILMSETKESY